MTTKQFRGRHQLIKRLSAQVGSKDLALGILEARGHAKDGHLTASGKRRDAMTSRERAIDRAAKASGHSTLDYKYNYKNNRATLKS